MTLLWLIPFLLHQGYTLVPVITVQLGEPITLTCHLTGKVQVHWYKQSVGNTLQLIAKVYQSVTPIYAQGFSASRFEITYNENKSNLIILSTVQQDEGMYHCAHMDWTQSTWTGTYLTLRGNSQKTSTYTVVQEKSVSDPTGPTNLETLQCSVLSYSENRTCSGEPSVFWFRTRSETSYPDVIYIDEKRNQNCEKQSNNQKKCGYNFSKNVSSSEADTYYCAVATCGEIIFGNGTKVAKSNQEKTSGERTVWMITLISLAISVIFNIISIFYCSQRSVCTQCKESFSSEANSRDLSQPINESENRQDLNYAALYFSGGKEQKGKKKREMKTEERIYSKVVFNSDI
ncbi:PREDICTED: uncharacterized protein LOC107100480 [Cyprinodon variegatus]|uniref:uncharacterized protein LOC107100480 n=1 Tax=Cyprinodon variegatus TaxID=28743 RepID=UPI00074278FF|nr:PREDICTED: uncharacterized protein LOC107100480 [Cyprinodon variegatus]